MAVVADDLRQEVEALKAQVLAQRELYEAAGTRIGMLCVSGGAVIISKCSMPMSLMRSKSERAAHNVKCAARQTTKTSDSTSGCEPLIVASHSCGSAVFLPGVQDVTKASSLELARVSVHWSDTSEI